MLSLDILLSLVTGHIMQATSSGIRCQQTPVGRHRVHQSHHNLGKSQLWHLTGRARVRTKSRRDGSWFYSMLPCLSSVLVWAEQCKLSQQPGLVQIRSDMILVSLCQDAVLLLIKYLEVYLNNKWLEKLISMYILVVCWDNWKQHPSSRGLMLRVEMN